MVRPVVREGNGLGRIDGVSENSRAALSRNGLLGRKRPKWSIAAAKQFTQVPDDSPPSVPRKYGRILVRRNCGHGG